MTKIKNRVSDSLEWFSLDQFYRINRRLLIWGAIAWLVYILRDFFALIFVTFLLVSFTLPVIDYLQRNTRMPRRVIIIALYLLIVGGLVGAVCTVVPQILKEAMITSGQIGTIQEKLLGAKDDLKAQFPTSGALIDRYFEKDKIAETIREVNKDYVQPFLGAAGVLTFKAISTTLLSLLFSFLIVLDLSRLRLEVERIGRSKLHDFYAESAQPVVRFGQVIARSFQAQAVIAVSNTCLTLLGFTLLGLPNLALLSIIVFFLSFIPVLGVFMSTTPAVLIAFNMAGYPRALGVIVLVVIIHLIEAYVLNPLIYGRHLKLNPVIVLIILFVGHHFFGVWGMLLGVPVSYYFLFYVFRVPHDEDDIVGNLDGGIPAPESAEKSPSVL